MVRVSDDKIKSIFKKLPVGFYLGRNVRTVVLDEKDERSYYNPLLDKVCISLPMVRSGIDRIDSNEYSEKTVESLIRGLLYHEISHIILSDPVIDVMTVVCKGSIPWYLDSDDFTNRGLCKNKLGELISNILNIFEDERIETLFKDKFLNTNFKKNLARIVNIDDYPENNPITKFYRIVRFRVGEDYLIKQVDEIIETYDSKTLNSSTSSNDFCTRNYIESVIKLFLEVFDSIPQEDRQQDNQSGQEEDGNSQQDDGQGDSGGNSNGNGSSSSSPNNSENNNNDSSSDDSDNSSKDETQKSPGAIIKEIAKQSEDGNGQDIQSIMGSIPDEIKEFIKDMIEQESPDDGNDTTDLSKGLNTQIYNGYEDKKLIDMINKIFNDSKNISKKNATATHSYSGVFDPRSAGRDDCRFFVSRARNGSTKMYSKYNLNLYVDCSGSFQASEGVVNKLLYALKLAERSNPNFTLNVAAIGDGVRKFDFDKEHAFVCNHGTALNTDIFKIVKDYTSRDAVNRSIVLIDGDAFECGRRIPECFKAFNSKDFYLIVDQDNEDYVEQNCPKAHTIIHDYDSNKSYSDLLIERVLQALETLTR